MTASDPASRTGVWIRTTLEAPLQGEPYAQLWFAFFDAADPARNFALNRKFPIRDLACAAEPFEAALPGAVLRHDGARGEISGHGHSARWDLSWAAGAQSLRYLPRQIYGMAWPPSKALSPTPAALVTGTLVADGRELAYLGASGAQSHVWGKKHAHAWSWHRCSGFQGRPEVGIEGLVVRVKRGPVVTGPLTMLCLWMGAERFELTRFRDILFRNRGVWSTGRLDVQSRAGDLAVRVEYRCRPEDLVTAEYHDPDGEASYCANTMVADCTLTLSRAGKVEVLRARETGQFEYAARAPDAAVLRLHEEVL